jgi:hypothetical protein
VRDTHLSLSLSLSLSLARSLSLSLFLSLFLSGTLCKILINHELETIEEGVYDLFVLCAPRPRQSTAKCRLSKFLLISHAMHHVLSFQKTPFYTTTLVCVYVRVRVRVCACTAQQA